jgi:hypothetical protein
MGGEAYDGPSSKKMAGGASTEAPQFIIRQTPNPITIVRIIELFMDDVHMYASVAYQIPLQMKTVLAPRAYRIKNLDKAFFIGSLPIPSKVWNHWPVQDKLKPMQSRINPIPYDLHALLVRNAEVTSLMKQKELPSIVDEWFG